MKKILLLIMVMLITISSVFGGELNTISQNEELGEVTVEYKDLNSLQYFLSSIGLDFLSISLDPISPKVGDRVKVSWLGIVYCENGNLLDKGVMTIQKQGSYNSFASVDLDVINQGGFSGQLSVSFSKQLEEGNYVAKVTYADAKKNVCYEDTKVFDVVKPADVKCPSNYCENWKIVTSIKNGDWQERTCFTYTSDPCTQKAKYEQKIFCDDGFYLDGGVCKEIVEQSDVGVTEKEENEKTCNSINSEEEFCDCFPQSTNCVSSSNDSEVDVKDGSINKDAWYMQGNNFYYIIGISLLFIVILLIIKNKGGRR